MTSISPGCKSVAEDKCETEAKAVGEENITHVKAKRGWWVKETDSKSITEWTTDTQ